jgi:hypothetical protein
MYRPPVIPYGPLNRQLDGMYRSGGYVKTIGSTTDTLGKLVKKRGGSLLGRAQAKMRRGGSLSGRAQAKMKC